MKTITWITLTLGFCVTAYADEAFDKRKAEMLSHIDERAQKLQEHKACVSTASDQEALKSCHKKMKEWRKSERTEHMEKRKGRMDKRMDRMKDKN